MVKQLPKLTLFTVIGATAALILLIFIRAIIDAVAFQNFGVFVLRFCITISTLGFGIGALIAAAKGKLMMALAIMGFLFLPYAIELPRSIVYDYADFSKMLTWIEFISMLIFAWLFVLFIFVRKAEGFNFNFQKLPLLLMLPLLLFLGFFGFVDSPQQAIYSGLVVALALFTGEFLIAGILLVGMYGIYPFVLLGTLILNGAPSDAGTWLEWMTGLLLLGVSIFYLIALITKMKMKFIPEGGADMPHFFAKKAPKPAPVAADVPAEAPLATDLPVEAAPEPMAEPAPAVSFLPEEIETAPVEEPLAPAPNEEKPAVDWDQVQEEPVNNEVSKEPTDPNEP